MPKRRLDNGYMFAEDASLIAYIVVYDVEKHTQDVAFDPTEEEIRRLCEDTQIPFEPVMEVINNRNKDTHTLMIDAGKFREANGWS